jgi:hypothetical protein
MQGNLMNHFLAPLLWNLRTHFFFFFFFLIPMTKKHV